MNKFKLIRILFVIITILNIFLPRVSKANDFINNIVITDNEDENELQNEIEDIDANIIEENNIDNEQEKNESEEKIEEDYIDIDEESKNVESNDNIEKKESKSIEKSTAILSTTVSNTPSVKYTSHVQDIGWQEGVSNGEESGTTGKNKKIEAIKISIENLPGVNVKYVSYIQGNGWQSVKSNGQESGTTGKNLRMEAIKIWLEGTNDYSIMYRTHIQDFGWEEKWNYDGAISGNLGDNKKIEAIEIKIVSKVSSQMTVSYSSYVQDIGWQDLKNQYDISGTTGKNKKIESLKINLNNAPSGVSIKYKTYVENAGWQSWAYDGEESGTTGRNLKVYGIRIQLEGTTNYTIQYRAHIQDVGWSSWKTDGAVVGEIAKNKKIEAVQIRILNTSSTASGNLGVEYYTILDGNSSNENNVEKNGELSGTTGENRKMEGIQIELLNASPEAHIKYMTHVQNKGWMDWKYDGEVSGVINAGLKIEAIRIELEGLSEYSVEYMVHVQSKGWMDWCADSEIAGTTGVNKKIEAIKIRIVKKSARGKLAIQTPLTNTTYKTENIQTVKGWKVATTANSTIRAYIYNESDKNLYNKEILQDKISYLADDSIFDTYYGYGTKTQNPKPVYQFTFDTSDMIIGTYIIKVELYSNNNVKLDEESIRIYIRKNITVKYNSYLNSVGWQGEVLNSEVSGTTGENRKMEALKIQLVDVPSNVHIKYSTHVENVGWSNWSTDGDTSGRIGENLKIEAIKIQLEGLSDYTVQYKVHIQDYGWTAWFIDGEEAGTTGQNKKIEAIKINIVSKYSRTYFKGVDVSYCQPDIDFSTLMNSGDIDFMITRIGWYSESKRVLHVDTQFTKNYDQAKSRNLPLGAYLYSYAESVDEAKREANEVVNYLKSTGRTNFELPIFYDIEDACQLALDNNTRTQMAIAFCDILKNAGYDVGVYSYSYWLTNYMNLSHLPSNYSLWIANFGSDDGRFPSDIYKYYETHNIWQYTSKGSVPGISTEVDMNICYTRYF